MTSKQKLAHCFPTYDECYKGYGLTKCKDGAYTACSDINHDMIIVEMLMGLVFNK